MKKQITFLVSVLLLMSKISYCDIIPDNSHYVEKCVKITNIDDYPEVSLLGFIPPSPMGSGSYTYVITSAKCLTKGYKFNDFNIFAIKKEYLTGKDINEIDLPKDPNAISSNIHIEPYGGYVNDSIHISAIDQYYRIVGFSETSAILHKWKEVTRFNNGKPDSTKTYEYDGELSKLYQIIQTNINSNQYYSSIEIYPNPAQKNFHLKITSRYQGTVQVEITTISGKRLRYISLNKTGAVLDHDIRIENFATGSYVVNVRIGDKIVTKKILIR